MLKLKRKQKRETQKQKTIKQLVSFYSLTDIFIISISGIPGQWPVQIRTGLFMYALHEHV